jgi:N-acetylglucosamine-6-phosphate deacetylase
MTLLTNAIVVTGQAGETAGWLRTGGELVAEVGSGDPRTEPGETTVDLGGATVVPGFVDLHCHGGNGAAYPTTDGAAARKVADFHAVNGTTTCMGSLVTAPLDVLEQQISTLIPLVEEGVLAGIHLEGPWLNRQCKGAHDESLLAEPAAADVQRMMAAAGRHLRMVTIAPELPGGLDAVRTLAAAGVVVAVGHTAADASVVDEALAAGAAMATHLFNGMPLMAHRAPGPVGALLTSSSDVVLELICDGHHVDPRVLKLAIDHVGPERIALITDAMAAAGVGDGTYHLGHLDVVVSGGAARLATSGSLAGSTLTMATALRFVVQQVGRPLADAVTMASVTPARVLGRSDIGVLAAGRRADLVVLDGDLLPAGVMRSGGWLKTPDGQM